MALFVLIILIINNCFVSLLGSDTNNNPLVEIKPSSITGGQNVGFYKVEDTLNLTCSFKNETYCPYVNLKWVYPTNGSNRENHGVTTLIANLLILTIENLQENDSGDYKCVAECNGIPFFTLENTVKISVKNKKKECTDAMFQCSAGICIPKRYTCDGQNDCPNGDDESSTYCGPGNPCDQKLMCPDNRCIPFTWCCEFNKEPNCTIKVKLGCCSHVEKLTRDVDNDIGYQYDQQRFSDMGFLQTTVYTVIGCAMAFMFIVTIIVIAICRVHVRRTLLSRCPAANRNLAFGRGGNIHGNQFNGLSFYDLDLYLNRSGLSGSDLMSVNPLLVTYNINNGVQFVGRPVDPPPYCEIVTSPPKEGPPPPYASHEDLTENEDKMAENPSGHAEHLEICIESDATESDALLGATGQTISVISCNAMDAADGTADGTAASKPSDDPENHSRPLEQISKDTIGSVVSSESSQSEVPNDKSVDIVLVSENEAVLSENRPESLKVQNAESSSYVSGSAGDRAKGAVRKVITVKSIDNGLKRRTKNFSGHFKKF